jgi:hypothetical protein
MLRTDLLDLPVGHVQQACGHDVRLRELKVTIPFNGCILLDNISGLTIKDEATIVSVGDRHKSCLAFSRHSASPSEKIDYSAIHDALGAGGLGG